MSTAALSEALIEAVRLGDFEASRTLLDRLESARKRKREPEFGADHADTVSIDEETRMEILSAQNPSGSCMAGARKSSKLDLRLEAHGGEQGGGDDGVQSRANTMEEEKVPTTNEQSKYSSANGYGATTAAAASSMQIVTNGATSEAFMVEEPHTIESPSPVTTTTVVCPFSGKAYVVPSEPSAGIPPPPLNTASTDDTVLTTTKPITNEGKEVEVGSEWLPGPVSYSENELASRLLKGINRSQLMMIEGAHPHDIFDALLNELLSLTGSAYGFIGQVLEKEDNTPYLKTFAVTDISWSAETHQFYRDHFREGMEFYNLETLFGMVIAENRIVISNNPAEDPRRGGFLKIPKGHPPLQSFLGIPLRFHEELVGMIGIANRFGGYDMDIIKTFEPFIINCSNIIRSLKLDVAEARIQTRKKLFWANIAHELRTPLQGIIGVTELMKQSISLLSGGGSVTSDGNGYTTTEELDPNTLYENVDLIDQSSHLLLSLVNNVLDYTKLEFSSFRVLHERVSVIEVVEKAVSVMTIRARAKNLCLAIVFEKGLPDYVNCDPYLLQRAIIHLVSNAVKFSHNGNVTVYVSLRRKDETSSATAAIGSNVNMSTRLANAVSTSLLRKPSDRVGQGSSSSSSSSSASASASASSTHPDEFSNVKYPATGMNTLYQRKSMESKEKNHLLNNELSVTVVDEGIGIHPHVLMSIFQPFSQIDESDTRQYGGAGIGLATCSCIASVLGGNIHAESSLGEGSIFSFVCPVEVQDTTVTPLAPNHPHNIHLVVIEAHGPIRDALTWISRRAGWEVSFYSECEKAEEKAIELSSPSSSRIPVVVWGVDSDVSSFSKSHPEPESTNMRGIEALRRLHSSFPFLAIYYPGKIYFWENALDKSKLVILSLPLTFKVTIDSIISACSSVTSPSVSPVLEATSEVNVVPMSSWSKANAQLSSLVVRHRRVPLKHLSHIAALIVDDNVVNQKVFKRQLMNLGVKNIKFAADGKEAVELYNKLIDEGEIIDLILMDLQMPIMTGFESTELILTRAKHELSLSPSFVMPWIIATSASFSPETEDKCMSIGMNDMLPKPVSVTVLQKALTGLVKKSEDGTMCVEASS